MSPPVHAVFVLLWIGLQAKPAQSSFGPDIHLCPKDEQSAHFSWDVSPHYWSKNIVVASPSKEEVLIWSVGKAPDCVTKVGNYTKRITSYLCDTNELTFNLSEIEAADGGRYTCWNGALKGESIDNCGQTLFVQDVELVSEKCYYKSTTRKFKCSNVGLSTNQSICLKDSGGGTVKDSQSTNLDYEFPKSMSGNFTCEVCGERACSDVFQFLVASGGQGTPVTDVGIILAAGMTLALYISSAPLL